MRGRVSVRSVMVAEFTLDDGAHGGPFSFGGTLPVNSESLLADSTFDVTFRGRAAEKNLHELDFRSGVRPAFRCNAGEKMLR
jgi:hypothetical protein